MKKFIDINKLFRDAITPEVMHDIAMAIFRPYFRLLKRKGIEPKHRKRLRLYKDYPIRKIMFLCKKR